MGTDGCLVEVSSAFMQGSSNIKLVLLAGCMLAEAFQNLREMLVTVNRAGMKFFTNVEPYSIFQGRSWNEDRSKDLQALVCEKTSPTSRVERRLLHLV